jgi:D-alanyl-D-alanine carboxypeptidase (penicillin-binding protein 5/6)
MKRTYDQTYLTRNPKALMSRTARFSWKNRGKLALGLVVALIVLFFVSCLVTASDVSLSSAFAQGVHSMPGAPGPAPSAPGVYASAAALMEADNGRLLYEKNAHVKLSMASTTKMMTALVVREKLGLKDKVTITPEAAATSEQSINMIPGETLTVEQLLYALLVYSANDSAVALAQAAGGSVQGFVDLMNKKAQQLGANDSHFANPHGLDQQGHYSSAYDLALIGREVLKDPVLSKMIVTRRYDIPVPGQTWSRVLTSHNEILTLYPGATGIKTGYTGRAGQCLVASAERNGTSLVAVALNSQHRASDASALLDYGFQLTARIVLVPKDTVVGKTRVSTFPRRTVKAVPSGEISALSVKGAGDEFQVRTTLARQSSGSVKKGQVLGSIDYSLNGNSLGRQSVVAAASANKPGPIEGSAVFLWYSLCRMGRVIESPFR